MHTQYGNADALQLMEVEKPIPKSNEVLIKVFSASVNRTDCAMLNAYPFIWRFSLGLFNPNKCILGTEFSGRIEAIGYDVVSFKEGEKVYGFNDNRRGAHAEYLCIAENKAIATMPEGLSYEQAAASTEGAYYAHNFINKVNVFAGQKILINGATGGIGSALLQLTKNRGAEVTAVCNTKNINLIKSLGADKIIDYSKEDFTKDNERYDYVFDAVGKSTFKKCKSILKPGGTYISSELGLWMQNIFFALFTPFTSKLSRNNGKKVIFPLPGDSKVSLLYLKGLIELGKFKTVIDKEYPFEEVIEAFKYVDRGLKTGNVVITFNRK